MFRSKPGAENPWAPLVPSVPGTPVVAPPLLGASAKAQPAGSSAKARGPVPPAVAPTLRQQAAAQGADVAELAPHLASLPAPPSAPDDWLPPIAVKTGQEGNEEERTWEQTEERPDGLKITTKEVTRKSMTSSGSAGIQQQRRPSVPWLPKPPAVPQGYRASPNLKETTNVISL